MWETKSAYSLKYLYDESCSVIGVTYKRNADAEGKSFFYKKNLQGDVIAVLDSLGRTVGTYSYDAWGKVTLQQCVMGDWRCKCSGYGYGYSPEDCECSEYRVDDRDRQIVYINPIRYRGYYYDTETKLYYLNSRYYDPATGRFLNADDTQILTDGLADFCEYNLYIYCKSDPINSVDPLGMAPIGLAILQGIVTFFVCIFEALEKITKTIKFAGGKGARAFSRNKKQILQNIKGLQKVLKIVVLVLAIGGLILDLIENYKISKKVDRAITDTLVDVFILLLSTGLSWIFSKIVSFLPAGIGLIVSVIGGIAMDLIINAVFNSKNKQGVSLADQMKNNFYKAALGNSDYTKTGILKLFAKGI